MSLRLRRWLAALPLFVSSLAAPLLGWPASAAAAKSPTRASSDALAREPAPSLPGYLEGVGVEEHLGGSLPLGLTFLDDTGRLTRLSDHFGGALPVIITLNYSNCPMLCSLELNGLVNALRELDLRLGESYRILTVSLDPDEAPQTAAATRKRYVEQYWGEDAAGFAAANARRDWPFLTGNAAAVATLAGAIGFKYRYDARTKQYYHAAAFVIASPGGKLMRYLYGIEYAPQTLRLALVEASQGKVGTTLDKLRLYCCAYDPRQGSYAPVAARIIRLGGWVSLVGLGGFLCVLWRREARKRQRRLAAAGRAQSGERLRSALAQPRGGVGE